MSIPTFTRCFALILVATAALAATTAAAEDAADPFAHLSWRNVGPVNMSGRVADVEGVPGDPRTVYVGTASGGVWKSTDGGLTFAPIFDDQPIASIGDMALAPGHPDILYVGSGEANVRNSVSFGNGVYKSTDGGASWSHLGLEKTRHISRLAVHPNDPNTVWVGAVGSIYGSGPERGVFKTTDGGETWRKVLFLDDHHGVADLDLDPTNPEILFATLWHFERKPWTFTSGGKDGGVWRSLDGGESWHKLDGKGDGGGRGGKGVGLPEEMGRIAVKIAPSRPETVYVLAESNDGILFRSDDRGTTFRKVSDDVDLVSRGFYYTDLRVDPTDENRVYAVASRLFGSIDGGKSFERLAHRVHIDFHSLWIDPLDPSRIWVGQDGGVAVSYDRGGTWEPIRNLPLAQLYQAFYDLREPFYYLGGGLQDNGTWYGPHRTREPAGILPDDWSMMSFGDAYWVVPHPEQVDLFLSEYQAGGILRTDMRTRQQVNVSPQPRRNDGGPVGELEYRFNWNSPIVASLHDTEGDGTVYFAGNVVFKTTDFGDTWEVISPDLTTNDPEKQKTAGGPVWPENTTAEYHCTLISFAESPLDPAILWTGSDDGRLHVTRDGGGTWEDLTSNIEAAGVPEFSPVSHVEPSRLASETAYASFDRHMFNDFRPHLFKTTDFGATWDRIGEGLPEEGWIWALREDPKNPQLIYAGTELGLHASWDGGTTFRKLHLENLPTVAVHDILVHPRENDLILGTHGRAIWVLDDATPVQAWNDEVAAASAHLFAPRPAMRFPKLFTRYGMGDKKLVAPNPPDGALLTYHLKESLEPAEEPGEAEEAEDDNGGDAGARGADARDEAAEKGERLKLEILDASGELVRELNAKDLPRTAGIHRVAWNLRELAPRPRVDSAPQANEFRGPPAGPYVLPGTYTVRLTVDGESLEQPLEVRVDPTVDTTPEALEAQYAMASKLTEMREASNLALRAMDLLEAQMKERRATLKALERELPEEVEEQWKALEESIQERKHLFVRKEGKPFWSQGPQLAGRLNDLFGSVDGAFAAPTAAIQELFTKLEGELETAKDEIESLLGEVEALNAELEAAAIPTLMIPEISADV